MQPAQSEIASHIPVLKDEVLAALALQEDSLVVDATYGRGGHTRAIMAELGDEGRLIVIDRDPAAIAQAESEWGEDKRVDIVHAPFSMLSEILEQRDLRGRITAMLFDFGVSSPQLDDAERGFSFTHDGPLDMRMDTTRGISAREWLQQVEEHELIHVLRKFGEERFARKVAARIKQYEEIKTTGELAAIVSDVVKTREPGKHPATRTFQAIRIAVNAELEEIASVLPQALQCLAAGGRLVIISFHSLEDRLVKRFFRDQSKGDPFPPDLPVTNDMLSPTLRQVGKPIKAGVDELDQNRRARSAILRVVEKTD